MGKMKQVLEHNIDKYKWDMYDTLKEIAKAEGRYSMDRMKHAENTIEDMQNKTLDMIRKVESLND